ncbi:hypothetical protein CONCODRAFT_6391 [Conidiobolus coronatus NRRL 28638]|uniref:RNI-like protein n=1 Tax=Conidiobolus coronatus (strain ATCC 28846 / CBS 209.66 / NRRL 28638) TaxID=796925 RepID=A0A137P7M7_CONC2|nr:hypothetical protein CONCODRAFT_6391 [Conidiobolus coronatus NRRL 28638]|eukprot:KXN70944.1 hypothetical protein CONCODRAFT_6391 [Conidiobolus coronatus NRRL 28638]
MNAIDNRITYSLLCNKILLQYLDAKDKTEFSSTCKFIFQKCSRFRLSVYKFNLCDFVYYTNSIYSWIRSPEEIYNEQLEYINKIINIYRPHLLSLTCIKNANYFILEYFSIQFDCLRSLFLNEFCIPQQTFKNVIDNLPNLHELVLIEIGVALELNNFSPTELKFPKYLTKFTMQYCYQFNCNHTDPVYLTLSGASLENTNRYNFEISNINISRIKYLSWANDYERGINTLNELLANNHKMEKLEVFLDRLNPSSLLLISNNRNLNTLVLSAIENTVLKSYHFPKLPFVKRIELKDVFAPGMESIGLFLRNCPNLEELKFGFYTDNADILLKIIKNFKNLKKLSITHMCLDLLLSAPFPETTVEHLEFTTRDPFRTVFSVFNNLKHLKSVSLNGLFPLYNNYDYTNQLFDGYYYWREIRYSNSVKFWKTKQKLKIL